MKRRIKLRQLARKKLDNDSGNVMLLVALMMVVLSGIAASAVDAGVLYVDKQHAQSSADAGALAGADVILQGATVAANTAYQISAGNDGSAAYQVTTDTSTNSVAVSGSQTVPLWFARVFGVNSAALHVTSTATIGTLVSGTGMVPIAVTSQTFTYGQEVNLTDSAGNGQTGNYGFLDFSGSGACGLETDIEHGYDVPLSVGDQVPTQTGVVAGPVAQAINYRLSEADNEQGCTFGSDLSSDCARVLYLPVVNTLNVCGKKDVTILGFAAFYLEGLSNSGGHQIITGKFIQMIRPGTIGIGTDYGTYSVKLTHS